MQKFFKKSTVVYIILIIVYFCIIFGFSLFNITKYNKEIKSNKGLEDIIENIEDYRNFFEEQEIQAEVIKEKEAYLKIIFSEDKIALYDTELRELIIQVEKEGEEAEVSVYFRKNSETAQVTVKNTNGIVGGKYKVPDFDNMIPDWGDYMDAKIKIGHWISGEEIKEFYEEAKEMEQKLIEECQKNIQ